MKIQSLLLTLTLAASTLSTQAGEARLMRFPATNGTEVAFSYAGDIYTVGINGGTARRLTSHNGYEAFARYSPDGSQIAFTAQYDGNTYWYWDWSRNFIGRAIIAWNDAPRRWAYFT